jgi:hypothetical protein
LDGALFGGLPMRGGEPSRAVRRLQIKIKMIKIKKKMTTTTRPTMVIRSERASFHG